MNTIIRISKIKKGSKESEDAKKTLYEYISSLKILKDAMKGYSNICAQYYINVEANNNYSCILNAISYCETRLPNIQEKSSFSKTDFKGFLAGLRRKFPDKVVNKTIKLDLEEDTKIARFIRKIKKFFSKIRHSNSGECIELYGRFLNEIAVKLPLHIASCGDQDYSHWKNELENKFGKVTYNNRNFETLIKNKKGEIVEKLSKLLEKVNKEMIPVSGCIQDYMKLCNRYG